MDTFSKNYLSENVGRHKLVEHSHFPLDFFAVCRFCLLSRKKHGAHIWRTFKSSFNIFLITLLNASVIGATMVCVWQKFKMRTVLLMAQTSWQRMNNGPKFSRYASEQT